MINNRDLISIKTVLFEKDDDVTEEMREKDKGNQQHIEREREFLSHVPLLDEKVIEHTIVEKKNHDELLSKYTCEDLMEEQVEAKVMLNFNNKAC
jgi:hypothetical protein